MPARKSSQYNSTRSRRVRTSVAATLPAPCIRCGAVVTAEMRWDADHLLSRADARDLGVSDADCDAMAGPAHRSCNLKAAGELTARRNRERATQPRVIERIERPQPSFLEEPAVPRALPNKISPQSAEVAD